MKSILISSLVLIVACAKVEPIPSKIAINYDKEISPLKVPAESKDKIKSICDALDQREPELSSMVGRTYTFEYATKECSAEEVSEATDTVVEIAEESSGIYKFFLEGTTKKFYFQDVDTSTLGSMKDLCPATLTTSPIINGNDYIFFTTESIPASDCPPVTNEQCIYIEQGVKSSKDGFATIKSREWIRYRLLSSIEGKTGFFTYKKNVIKSDCGLDEALVRQATLVEETAETPSEPTPEAAVETTN